MSRAGFYESDDTKNRRLALSSEWKIAADFLEERGFSEGARALRVLAEARVRHATDDWGTLEVALQFWDDEKLIKAAQNLFWFNRVQS